MIRFSQLLCFGLIASASAHAGDWSAEIIVDPITDRTDYLARFIEDPNSLPSRTNVIEVRCHINGLYLFWYAIYTPVSLNHTAEVIVRVDMQEPRQIALNIDSASRMYTLRGNNSRDLLLDLLSVENRLVMRHSPNTVVIDAPTQEARENITEAMQVCADRSPR